MATVAGGDTVVSTLVRKLAERAPHSLKIVDTARGNTELCLFLMTQRLGPMQPVHAHTYPGVLGVWPWAFVFLDGPEPASNLECFEEYPGYRSARFGQPEGAGWGNQPVDQR